MNVRLIDCEKGFKQGMQFEEIESLLSSLFNEEDLKTKILSNPYL